MTISIGRAALLVSTALLPATALAQAAGSAPAPAPAAADSGGLDEIVVTARRQAENLQDTPIAVTAFGAQAIAERSASNLAELADFAPNVQFLAGGNAAGGSNAQVFIRGVGQDDFLPTADPGVGIYVDGVYLGRSVGGVLKTADLAQVEILRGPQGTLFGRNTIGGAINIRTTEPNFNKFEGYAQVTGGSDKLIEGSAAVGGPLSPTLAFRVSGTYRSRDGYDRSVTDGTEFGNENYGLVRGKLEWRATEKVTVTLGGDWYKQRQHNLPVSAYAYVCADGSVGICANTPSTGLPSVSPTGLTALYNSFIGGPTGKPFTNDQVRSLKNPFDTSATGPSRDDAEVWGVSGTVAWELNDNLSLKSITAYRHLDAEFSTDNDGAAVDIAATKDAYRQHQFSQELQLLYTSDRVKGVVGAYYFNETGRDSNFATITPGLYNSLESLPLLVGSSLSAPPGLPGVPCPAVTFAPVPGTPFRTAINPLTGGGAGGFGCSRNIANTGLDNELYIDQTVRVRNYAVFGQASVELTDRLSLTAGLRYTYEEKRFDYFQQRLAVSAALGQPYYAVAPTRAKDDFKNLAPRLGLEYHASDDVMLYGSYAKGFKSGTFNGRATNTQGVASVDPEKVDQFEAGVKSEFADRRVRLNVAGFYSKYRDLQLQSVVSDPAQGLLINLVNAGRARIYGFEAELTARPIPALELGGNLGYTNSRITSIDPAVALSTGVQEGNRLKKAPEWTASTYAQYTLDFAGGALALRVDYSYTGTQYHDAANNPDTRESGYGLVNARLAFTDASDRFTVAVYGRNLTDEIYYNALFRNGGGQSVAYPARTREWGVSGRFNF